MSRSLRALALTLLPLLGACWGKDAYIVEGTVVEVRSPTEIVVDHEAVYGLMPEMVMPFQLEEPGLGEGLERGDRIVARLMMEDEGAVLDKLRVTGHTPMPPLTTPEEATGVVPLRPGGVLEATAVPVTGGTTWTLGAGQGVPTVLTFIYVRCPIPEFCPAMMLRFQELQAELEASGTAARLLAVTVDPDHDTLEVLAEHADSVGAKPSHWRFGRLEGEALTALTARAALAVMPDDGEIIHNLRTLVLDGEGRLVERYDDAHFPADRILSQLATGEPKAPAGSDGTISRPPGAGAE